MPYDGEYATGHTLARLVDHPAVRDFDAEIKKPVDPSDTALPTVIAPDRNAATVNQLIAVDGSTVTSRIANGYPGAEASLLNVAVVVIELTKLRNLTSNTATIPSPTDVRNLERYDTVSAVLPGRNVVGKTADTDTPSKFFRWVVHRMLNETTLLDNDETLLETLLAVTNNHLPVIKCPGETCERKVTPQLVATTCSSCGEIVYPSDSLRCHERFDNYRSSAAAFTAARTVAEHLTIINQIRWHANHHLLNETGFVMDGPLAVFGDAAWINTHIQNELTRIHQHAVNNNTAGLLLMGVAKHGMFMDHLETIDFSPTKGERGQLPPSTVLAPDADYINKHITPRPADSRSHATYYGRHLMYKSRSSQHTALTLPIVNPKGKDPTCVAEDAYPRVGDAVDLIDELGTHLYKDGFSPLTRAHMHAAVPLRRGTEILDSILARQ